MIEQLIQGSLVSLVICIFIFNQEPRWLILFSLMAAIFLIILAILPSYIDYIKSEDLF